MDALLAQRKEEDEKLPEEDEIAIVASFEGGIKRLLDDDEPQVFSTLPLFDRTRLDFSPFQITRPNWLNSFCFWSSCSTRTRLKRSQSFLTLSFAAGSGDAGQTT